MKDFTRESKKIEFKIAPDVFEVYPSIPANILLKFATSFQGLSTTAPDLVEVNRAVREMLSMALKPDSLIRFLERMESREDTIDLDQASDVIQWLFEEYGMRPMQPSELSLTGPADLVPGTSWTGSSQDEVSISAASPSTAS